MKAYSQSGSQDLLMQEARSSWESQQDAESYGENRSNTANNKMLGISISTVKLQIARRQNKVTKLSTGKKSLKTQSKAGDQQVQRGNTKMTQRHEQNRNLRTF